jgi:hypothetical protein
MVGGGTAGGTICRQDDQSGTSGPDRGRLTCADWRTSGLFRKSRISGSVGICRRRAGLCRNHGLVWNGLTIGKTSGTHGSMWQGTETSP